MAWNPPLLVQSYLENHSLENLREEHGVRSRIARGYKFSLNYDQIEAREDNILAQQCRGLVLRTGEGTQITETEVVGPTVILAHPFHRFFNHGQGAAARVNLDHPETAIFEKLDGTLIILAFDDIQGKWHISTRSVAEADMKVGPWEYTFRTLFERTILEVAKEPFESWAKRLDQEMTYLFELCTPYNQVVVQHENFGATLIGARTTRSGREWWPDEIAPSLNVPHVQRYRFGNQSEMFEFVRNMNGREQEGIVACQEVVPGRFCRIKVKNAGYLALNKLSDKIQSPRNVMELILLEQIDDALSIMHEDVKNKTLQWQSKIRHLIFAYNKQYHRVMNQVTEACSEPMGSREHRKMFAQTAMKEGIWFEPAMAQYSGKAHDVHDFIDQQRSENGEYKNSFLDLMLKKVALP